MIKKNPRIIILTFLLLTFSIFLSMLVYAQSVVGCCINPGAGALSCSPERLSQQSECCPKPEGSNPSYYDAESNGPSNFNECVNSFFFPGQSCDSVQQCEQGCCCAGLSGSITSQAQCTGIGTAFHAGATDCNAVCNIPQCNDGIDNDNNGCADFPSDSGCLSLSDSTETGGTCLQTAGPSCDNINYIPKISGLTAVPLKGQKNIQLEWENECLQNLVSNEISRCEGQNCNDFEVIESTTASNFLDEDEHLKFDAAYTYRIQSRFSVQTAKPTATIASALGSLECWSQFSSNNFCISEFYYNQYQDYIIRNFAGFSKSNFIQNVRSTFADRLNSAFFCDEANLLKEEGTTCGAEQVCVVANNNPQCVSKSSCNPDDTNPFGLFFTRNSCQANNYCFYDRSLSSVDSCFACSPQMSCYDYKSKESCEANSCSIGNCAWKPISGELGTGVCVDESSNNCQWCDSLGTEGIESTKATSSIFEQCTQRKAQLLSTDGNACYYDGQSALNCQQISCTDYQTEECSNSNINHDSFNRLTNPSPDQCGLGICQNFNGVCRKNADGDNKADCSSGECEQDVYAPNTTIIPLIDRGIYKSLSVQIFDKVSPESSYIKRDTNDYKTYLCKEPCGQNGHPFQKSTNSFNIIISNLDLFDSITGEKLLELSEGTNTVKYYSQDPSKNIGAINTLNVVAHQDSNGPIVFKLEITNGKLIDNIYYTNSKNPVITASFLEEAIVTSARLLIKGTEIAIIPDFTNQLSKSVQFTFQRQINPGTYVFELNAKNEKGIFMDEAFNAEVVFDDSNPEIISIDPSDGSVVTSSDVPVAITFNKKTSIEKITINGLDVTEQFSTSDSIVHTATLSLQDGNKEILIDARDFAGNPLTFTSKFIVNSNPLEISIIEPSFGVSPIETFDLVIGTDNDATCRYSLDNNLEFDFMGDFDTSGSILHTKQAFNDIPSGDRKVHKLYVRCNDPLQGQNIEVFDLSVDPDAPKIVTVFAFPNPIVEEPRITSLKVEADKEAICRYSIDQQDFDLMESKFPGFDNNTFRKVSSKEITVEEDGSYSYFVACKSKSELTSQTKQISFTSDIKLPIVIVSHTPEFSNSSLIALSLETNKKSQCKYSDSDPSVSQGTIMGPSSYSHTKQLSLSPGTYTYHVICRDQFLREWSSPLAVKFTIDTTEPFMVFVDDTSTLVNNPETTWRLDKLRAKWLGNDNETKVKSYEYTLEEFGTLNTIINWTTSFIENEWTWITKKNSSLNLLSGSKYFFRVRAKNIVGLTSEPLSSDGISIDTSLIPTACSNGIKDPQESDIDCGGPCELCAEGLVCSENSDCFSGFCNAENLCAGPTCNDNVKNQDESDIDCGGNACVACENAKSCNIDSDCESNFCSFGICKDAEACSDGTLTGTESDIDCGGACPNKCQLGQSCTIDADCGSGLACVAGTCSEGDSTDLDTDGDGIPDQWELQQGLDPNDPSDASSDFDNDGLTNLEEYTYGTNPNNADTDGDKASDKKEIDKGTDPLDPLSKPKSIMGTILIILVVVALLAGTGYGGYYIYQKYSSKPKSSPIAVQRIPIKHSQRKVQTKAIAKPKPEDLFKKREEEKKQKRGKMLDIFGAKKERPKGLISKSEAKKKEPITRPQKEKEDVFSKLKLISKKEDRKSAGKEDSMKKLRAISKKKKRKKPRKR